MPISENENDHSDTPIDLRSPSLADGAAMWRLTRDTGVLDLNSSYQYLLWCRDFSATSVVAVDADEHVLGFITAFLRPDAPSTLMVCQAGVDAAARDHTRDTTLADAATAPHGPHAAQVQSPAAHLRSTVLSPTATCPRRQLTESGLRVPLVAPASDRQPSDSGRNPELAQ